MPLQFESFFEGTQQSFLAAHHTTLQDSLNLHQRVHGRADEWDAVLDATASSTTVAYFDQDTVTIGEKQESYDAALKSLMPWRKGPFQIGSTFVDTEWRSDWKWQRILPHISSLENRNVLDIGCGNGYHLFRMLGAGVNLALGIDPTILFNYQFQLTQKLSSHIQDPQNQAYLLPLRSEHLPAFNEFDSVFSLGVLYHRRSPVDHLTELFSFLRSGGELILETLIVEGDEHTMLVPEARYAKMANVWCIPATDLLEKLLLRTGFTNIRTVDITQTSTDEQRATPWMTFQSLEDFLDPDDNSKTIEGYPAPTRAILIANKP